jgi:hypothetical protein
MAALCFVAKFPPTSARVIGLTGVEGPNEIFEREVLPLVEIPGVAMHFTGIEPEDSFHVAARARIHGRVWTWIGFYRHAVEPSGRFGAYVASGILLPDETCPGTVVSEALSRLGEVVDRQLLSDGRLRSKWMSIALPPALAGFPARSYQYVRPLLAGAGLSPDADRFAYMGESNLRADQMQFRIDAVQTLPALNNYSCIVFGPSEHFAAKLVSRQELRRIRFQTGNTKAPAAPDRAAAVSLPPIADAPLESGGTWPPLGDLSGQQSETGRLERALQRIMIQQDALFDSIRSMQRWLERVAFLAFLVVCLAGAAIGYDVIGPVFSRLMHALERLMSPGS